MRHFIRLMVAILTFATGLTATAIWSALQPSAPAARNGSVNKSSNDSVNVTISPVKFYEWRRDMQLPESIGKDDEAAPAFSYHQIKDWNAGNESQTGQIDVVCQLENHGSQPVDLMILATGALWQHVEVKEQMRVPTRIAGRWNLGQQVIHLAPGEKQEVKFRNFDIEAVTHTYKAYLTLEPTELRVDVDVMTLDNMQTAWAGGQLRLRLELGIVSGRLPAAELTLPDNSSVTDAR